MNTINVEKATVIAGIKAARRSARQSLEHLSRDELLDMMAINRTYRGYNSLYKTLGIRTPVIVGEGGGQSRRMAAMEGPYIHITNKDLEGWQQE